MTEDRYKYFRIEARELVDTLGAAFLALEQGANPDVVQRALRCAHTLKGAARVVRLPEIAERAHAIEDLLAPVRASTGPVPRELVPALLAILDEITARVTALDSPPPQAAAPAPPSSPAPVRALRTEISEMDALLEGIMETHRRVGDLRVAASELARASQLAEVAIARITRGVRDAAGGDAGPVRAVVEQLRDLLKASERGVTAGLDHVDRELGQVRDRTEHLRLIPAATLFGSLERAVRDVCHELGRRAQFQGLGGDIRVDAPVIEAVSAALAQLVRNAVAHGIEPEAARRRAGKPAEGHVVVEVSRRARKIVFACRDDGRGLDLDAIRRAAIQRGLVAAELEPGALTKLLLRGGISTSTVVTEVSGRGIGLDVAREVVTGLGGEVSVRSEPGTGTTFELVVPTSLTAVDALIVESGGTTVAIPIDAVVRTAHVGPTTLSRSARSEALLVDGQHVPFVWLPTLLSNGVRPAPTSGVAVILKAPASTAAFGVERLVGNATIVVRTVPERARADAIVAGAWLDAGGAPQIVLDPEGVLTAARRERDTERPAVAARVSILVIDDSLTTRMLEQSILESAGYDVDAVTSGEDGLVAARAKRYGLFLVDVEMPGMDGFTFIERVRADPVLRDTPALLVTSRASPEDRRRGVEAGASGYVVKSEFDQVDLLARIERMVR